MTSTGMRTSSAASGQLLDAVRSSPLDDDVCALDVAEARRPARRRSSAIGSETRPRNPTRGRRCCARTPNGQLAAPPRRAMKSRLQLIELHRVTAGLGDHRIFDFTTGVCPVAPHIRGLQQVITDSFGRDSRLADVRSCP